MDNYLSVLEDSLKKKLQILDELTDYTMQQQELLKVEELDYEAFDRLVDQKDPLIQRIMELDQGFETVYDRIKEQLLSNKEQYACLLYTSLVMMATPAGSMTAMLAQQYGGDYETASRGVALTTVLSVITMPLLAAVFL